MDVKKQLTDAVKLTEELMEIDIEDGKAFTEFTKARAARESKRNLVRAKLSALLRIVAGMD
jgi:hypothetical protein